ncbi:MAG TPA: glycosyltransferase family A protein [Anaerolineales bacterium]|jgi:glycosyltransferase involved in cell wall biosynthesis
MATSPSIVIRAFNEEKHIGKLLAGIAEQTLDDPEIIVVDSGSTDATVAIASRFGVRVVHVEPEEFTFGRSLNLGCQAATRQHIVIASAHVFPVYPDWLERLVAPFEDPAVALSYGKQRGGPETKFSEHQIFAKLYPDQSQARQHSPVCNNANAAIRRQLWRQHPYDESLSGLEDLAWAQWALAQGHYLAYVAEAEVIHIHEESARQVYNRYQREAIALRRIRPQESFYLVDLPRLYLSNVASDLYHAKREGRLGETWRRILWFRWMQFWGTYRGFVHRGPLDQRLKETFYYPRAIRRPATASTRKMEPIDYGHLQE